MDQPKAGSGKSAQPLPLQPVAWPPSSLAQAAELADSDRLQQELVQAQKMEAIGQLVSGVAHELNNPLASIIAFSQLIRRDPRLPEDLRHDADQLDGRFVFMSGDVLNPELRDFAAAHGIGLLAKPFDLDSVERTVRDLVDAEPQDDQPRG